MSFRTGVQFHVLPGDQNFDGVKMVTFSKLIIFYNKQNTNNKKGRAPKVKLCTNYIYPLAGDFYLGLILVVPQRPWHLEICAPVDFPKKRK